MQHCLVKKCDKIIQQETISYVTPYSYSYSPISKCLSRGICSKGRRRSTALTFVPPKQQIKFLNNYTLRSLIYNSSRPCYRNSKYAFSLSEHLLEKPSALIESLLARFLCIMRRPEALFLILRDERPRNSDSTNSLLY